MPRRVTILLMIEALVLGLLRLATDMRFDWFAFFDGGAELTVHALMNRGLRPTIDFGYIYGLLPLVVGESWYRVVGRSPGAFAAISILGGVITAWGIGRVLASLRVGWVGVIWVVVAMPIGLVTASAPSLVHVIEPILLTHGLADLATGRRSRALVLATICIFVKPSMAFLFLLAILAVTFVRDRPILKRDWTILVLPAVVVSCLFVLGLGGFFGFRVLMNTLLPVAGQEVYRQNGFGFFFGSGRAFWFPSRPKIAFYRDTIAGVWLAASGLLIMSAIRHFSLWTLAKPSEATQIAELDLIARREANPSDIIVICAGLHLAFVTLFFGNRWSWVYYFNFLVIGVAAVSTKSRAGRIAIVVLTLFALPLAKRTIQSEIESWSERRRLTETMNLWASDMVWSEWREVKRITHDLRPVLLAISDGAALLNGQFSPPEVSFLVRGHLRPSELDRKRAQVRSAQSVIVANPAPGDLWFDEWPEFHEDLLGHTLVWSCPRIRVYLRSPPGAELRISSKKSR